MQPNTVEFDELENPGNPVFSSPFNVASVFIDRHIHSGAESNIALKYDAGDISYGELFEKVNQSGNALLEQGLKAGERLLMVVVDSPEFFYAFWGAIKAGIIPIPINTMLRADDYKFYIEDCECRGVIYSPQQAREVENALSMSATPPRIALQTTGPGSLSAIMASCASDLEAAPASAEAECFWLYSSGSTGNPKGVVHVHRDMVITSTCFGQGIAGIEPTDIVYSASKLFFSYGFGGGMTFPLWAGAATVINSGKTTAGISFDFIEKYKPTVFFGVPTLYAQQLVLAETRTPDMTSIRRAVSAGEALPAHVYRQVKETFGFSILDGLGSTEALHIFVSNQIDDINPGTSGRVVPGYEVKILDDEGNEVAPGEIGTLWVRGRSTALCYWKNPEKTAATMKGGWLNTGDMYFLNEDGCYVNSGRGDDMLKVGGMWCSPIEIEAKLIEHPLVREVAVVGKRDDANLIKPAAYVVLANKDADETQTTLELSDFCKKNLAGYKYPRWFHYVDEIPKTVTGKIQRFKLR